MRHGDYRTAPRRVRSKTSPATGSFRRQGVGERGDRPVSRAAGGRSFHPALPVAGAGTGESAEFDPAAVRDLRVVGIVGHFLGC
jgi:hypothetical protein